MGQNTQSYRTFICYRGQTAGNPAGPEIARTMHQLLAGHEDFAPVFYAPEKRYEFIEDLEFIFQTVEKVIILLNPTFFSGFFLEGAEPNPESATRRELELAFGRHCEFYPVFTGDFAWNQIEPGVLGNLERHYGKAQIDRLRHISNPYIWKSTENPPEEVLTALSRTSLSNARRFLSDLKPETQRDFEVDVTEYAKRNNTRNARQRLREIIEDPDIDEAVAYAAFYTLQVMLRQLKEFEKMRANFEKYGSFSSHPSYSHIWILFLIESGSDFDSEEVLHLAEEDCREFSDNAGFVHMFPVVYATVCEQAAGAERAAIVEKWGRRAMEEAEHAIRLDQNYAKYYCTKARILALQKDFLGAERAVNQAIDKEDSQRGDYQIRLMDYQYHKIMIQVEKRFHQLEQEGTLCSI